MSWVTGPMLAFDTETTDAEPLTARIVTATVVKIHGADITPRTWLLRPDVPISPEATAIHGVSDAKAIADGMPAAQGLNEIALAVCGALRDGIPVVAYNASFDLTVLEQELIRNGMPPLDEWIGHDVRPIIDPHVIDRKVDKYRRGSRTLTAACGHYKVALNGAHDATQDALAAARVAWRIAQQYPMVADSSLDDLHDAQIDWHESWARGFRDYLTKKGDDPSGVDGSWPLRQPASVPA